MNRGYKVIVKAWIKKDNKYLLAKRGKTEKHHAGVWSLPGGNVDFKVEDNIIENTLNREIREEIGIEIEPNIELIYTNSFIKTSDHSRVINLTFLAYWKSGDAKPLQDTAQVKWCTYEELTNSDDLPNFLTKEIEALGKTIKQHNL